MLHRKKKKIGFLVVALATLFPYTVRAQSVQGQFAGRDGQPYPVERRFLWRPHTTKALGENLHALVILAEFGDVAYTHSREDFVKVLVQQEKSARDYFRDQLGQDIDITVKGPYKVDRNRSWYGSNNSSGYDMHPGTFIADVCRKADEDVDFSIYDDDGDGYVDNVYVFYAGEDESQQKKDNMGKAENPDFLWAHSSTLENSDYKNTLELDGVKINGYACSSELYRIYTSPDTYDDIIAPIGTFCHEHSHIFGLVDLYDTDYEKSGGKAAGVWVTTALMDGGNYNADGTTPPNYNAISREIIGLQHPVELEPGTYTLIPTGRKGSVTYKITNPADSAEYYLFECRSNEGWDRYIGGKGLLVYHIDKSPHNITESETLGAGMSSALRWNLYNQVNCRPDHQCADLIEADGRSDSSPSAASLSDISGIFFPQTGATSLGGDANIKLSFWDGTEAQLSITGISLSGQDGTVSFTVKDNYSPLPPRPVNPPADTDMIYILVQDNGSSVKLEVNNDVGAESVEWYFNGSPIGDSGDFVPGGDGEIMAVINWEDGSRDRIFKKIKK